MLDTTTSQINKPHNKNNMKHEYNHATHMNTFHVYVYYEKYANFPEGSDISNLWGLAYYL
jgi:hypothetical protein